MKNHHEVGHFKCRLMIVLLSLIAVCVMAGQSFAAMTCSSCHGMPPLDSSGNRVPSTGAFKGSHQTHVIPAAVATDCVVCHSAAAGYDMKHSATSGNIIGLSANINGGTYSKGASFNQTSMPIMGTCSNVSCHADPYSAGSVMTPDWGTSAGCAACHTGANVITANGPATGSHTTVADHAVACITCHEAGTTATTKPSTGHIDTNIDVANVGYATLNKTKGTAGTTCSTASCHADPYSAGTVTTPAWGTTGNGCAACHTGANVITANGPATGSHTTVAGHAVACITCHAAGTTATTKPSSGHADTNIDVANVGYATLNKTKGTAGTTCSTASCHADPYSAGYIVTPAWGTAGNGCAGCHTGANVITASGPVTGSHTTVAGHAVACITCHEAGTTATTAPSIGHADTNIDVANVGYATLNKAKGTAGTTCSTASCHADPYSSAYIVTPAWGATGNGCAACHTGANVITANGPATGSHTIVAGHAVACITCHAAGTTATIAPSTGHIDTNIDVANVGYVTLNKTKGTAGTTCSTASCHANPYAVGAYISTPAWGAPGSACSTCHIVAIGANGPATGSHTAHAGVACISCHGAGTTATTVPSPGNGHIDGNIDIFYFNYPADVAKHAAGSYTGTCSTAYCHSNGKGGYASPTWGATSTGCNFCHPSLSSQHSVHTSLAAAAYGNTADNSSGAAYNFGCGNCHPTDVGNHVNTTIEITLNSMHGGVLKSKNSVSDDLTGYTQNAGVSVTCAAAYCHSNGMATPTYYGASVDWYEASYTGDKCARCHGNSPNTGGKVGSAAHGAHVIGIHVEDIFNGVSRKLPIGGGNAVNAAHGRNNRSTTINCNICHALTVTAFENDKNSACTGCHDNAVAPFKGNASIADKSKHVNGAVEVSFIDQPIATKAQVAKSAFAAYTGAGSGGWSRNKNIYKTYTSGYDVTKGTLSSVASWSQVTGCSNVACHANINITWTAIGVTCTNCHTRLK